MKTILTLTDEHIKLIQNLDLTIVDDDNVNVSCHYKICGGHLLDDLSLILNLRDKAIKNTEDSSNGRAFPDEIEKYMLDLHNYIKDNLISIERFLHEYAILNGVQSGTYERDEETHTWNKIN